MRLINAHSIRWLALLLSFGSLWPAPANAIFVRGELSETIEAIAGDAYLLGNTATIRHNVRDDAVVVGNSVGVTAATGGDIVAVGNTVRLTGAVGDDIMTAGNEVRVAVPQVDDIFAAGSRLEIGGEAVRGSVYALGSQITISGTIEGTVRATGAEIIIPSGTTIRGDLLTFGENEPKIAEDVTISGARRHEPIDERSNRVAWAGALARRSLTWFVSGLLLLFLFPRLMSETAALSLSRSGRALGIGTLVFVLVLPLFMALLLSQIAWPIAWIVLAGAVALMIIAHVAAALVLGMWVGRLMPSAAVSRPGTLPWQLLLAGVVVLKLIQAVPVAGWLFMAVVTLLSLGALLEIIWRRMRYVSLPPQGAAAT